MILVSSEDGRKHMKEASDNLNKKIFKFHRPLMKFLQFLECAAFAFSGRVGIAASIAICYVIWSDND
jgi:hypothetical protein